jgi:hypothetical protein
VATSCCGAAAVERRCGRWPERRAVLTWFILVGGGPRGRGRRRRRGALMFTSLAVGARRCSAR